MNINIKQFLLLSISLNLNQINTVNNILTKSLYCFFPFVAAAGVGIGFKNNKKSIDQPQEQKSQKAIPETVNIETQEKLPEDLTWSDQEKAELQLYMNENKKQSQEGLNKLKEKERLAKEAYNLLNEETKKERHQQALEQAEEFVNRTNEGLAKSQEEKQIRSKILKLKLYKKEDIFAIDATNNLTWTKEDEKELQRYQNKEKEENQKDLEKRKEKERLAKEAYDLLDEETKHAKLKEILQQTDEWLTGINQGIKKSQEEEQIRWNKMMLEAERKKR